jgi:succinate dehydrogenase / fumarate reductase iron-sulfur subunit
MVVNGIAHGGLRGTTVCQLHMRHFQDGQTIVVEPWRAKSFPVLRDLVTDRSAFDRIIQAGGFVSVNTGGAPDGNVLPIGKSDADRSMDAAACIGCGACVAACKNASAMLFVSAKASHLGILPQGKPEKERRVLSMVKAMDAEGFGNCTVTGSCEAVCPKEISLDFIARMNREYGAAILKNK